MTENVAGAVVNVVEHALAPYGEGAALVEWGSYAQGGWYLEVKPASPGAAHVRIEVHDLELTVEFGGTHFYMLVGELDFPESLERLLEAVFAGRFVEAGDPENGFAVITDANRRTYRVGAVALPMPMSWRKTRRYGPYGRISVAATDN